MRISYDTEADALYIRIGEGEFKENREVLPGIVLDIGENGELLGIEVLEASRRYPLSTLAHVDIAMPLEMSQ
jgi:uncharacterized protein YuzE